MPASTSVRRPPPLFISKSLEGLEKVIPPEGYSASSSPTPSWKFDKPLPKPPRTPSSIYSVDIKSSDRSQHSASPRVEQASATTRSYPSSPGDKLSSSSSYFSEPNLLRPVTFSNAQPSSPLAQSHRPSSDEGTCYGDHDHEMISLGPYASDERECAWQMKTDQPLEGQNVARRTSTKPTTPSMQTAVESVDPVLVPLPLEREPLHRACSNHSLASLSGIERGASDSRLRARKSQPVLRRVVSEERPPKYDEENGHHVTWLSSSFSTLPSSKYAQEHCCLRKYCEHSISRHASSERRGRPGNRTDLYSFSTGTSQRDSDSSELCKCTRQRAKHAAIPQSEYQKYGPSSFSYSKEKRSSTLPRYISRLLPEPIRGRLSVNTNCSPPQSPSLPSPRRPATPSPFGINRTPPLPPSTWRESALRWQSSLRLTKDKMVSKSLEKRRNEKVKSRIVVLGGSSNRGTGENWASRWF